MKDEGFYNKAWKFTKNKLKNKNFYFAALKLSITVLFVLLLGFIFVKLWLPVWDSFIAIWNEKSLIQSEQPLQLAIGLLTLLVAIIAISMGALTWWTRRDWNRFREKQEPTIEKLKEDTDELNWINNLRTEVKEDPLLNTEDAKKWILRIKQHFEKDQYNLVWEYYGVARWFEKEEQYDIAIKYYGKTDIVDLDEDHSESKELRKHIRQSLGKNYFLRGRQREENGEKKEAIEDYEAAIFRYDWVIGYDPKFAMAHFNKASTLIQLGKIEGDKTEPYNDANYCFKEAIKCLKIIEDNYDHFYDKARAHALLDQGDKAIESLTRAFTLAKRDNLGDLFYYLARDTGDFKNVEGKAKFKALVERYRGINKGDN